MGHDDLAAKFARWRTVADGGDQFQRVDGIERRLCACLIDHCAFGIGQSQRSGEAFAIAQFKAAFRAADLNAVEVLILEQYRVGDGAGAAHLNLANKILVAPRKRCGCQVNELAVEPDATFIGLAGFRPQIGIAQRPICEGKGTWIVEELVYFNWAWGLKPARIIAEQARFTTQFHNCAEFGRELRAILTRPDEKGWQQRIGTRRDLVIVKPQCREQADYAVTNHNLIAEIKAR